MVTFETLIQNLQNIYFFSYFMPFIFVLAVSYGIIDKLELFEDNVVDATVSMVIAFMAMLGVYLLNLSGAMIYFFGAFSVGLVTVVAFVILAGMFGVEIPDLEMDKTFAGVAAAIVLAIGFILLQQFMDLDIGRYVFSEATLTLLMLGGMIAFVYFLSKNDD